MKVVSFYTDSHSEMLHSYLMPSIAREFSDFEIVKSDRQLCENGSIADPGFVDCMLEKLELLASQPINQKILYVDADCVFFDGAKQFFESIELEKSQIAFQWDDGQLCCGVALFVQTEQTRNWWQFVRDYSYLTCMMDQTAMNKLLNNAKRAWIKVAALPFPTVGNWSHVRLQNKLWSGEDITLNHPCFLWHANFTVGVENKMAMLEMLAKKQKELTLQNA